MREITLTGPEMLRVVSAAQLSPRLLAEDLRVEEIDDVLREISRLAQQSTGTWSQPVEDTPPGDEDREQRYRRLQAIDRARREQILTHEYHLVLSDELAENVGSLTVWARAHTNLDIAFRLADALDLLDHAIAKGTRKR